MTEEPKVAPFRSFDDFLIGGARFGPPDFKNQEKWTNRVAQNLLYYQSNYFVLAAIFPTICLWAQPSTMIYGLFLLGLFLVYIYQVFFIRHNQIKDFQKDYPIGYVALIIMSTIAFLYAIPSMSLLLLSILVPLLAILVHASFRMRNFANKVQNKVEQVGLKKTPMGQILNGLQGFTN